jgi:5-formyltetrahydrofolate cyclo-ligase
MNKSECRQYFLALRKNLSREEWQLRNEQILERVEKLCMKLSPGNGLLFYPIESKKEVDLRQLPERLYEKETGWTWSLPVMNDNQGLKTYSWVKEEPLVEAKFGVLEPKAIPERHVNGSALNLIIVPLVIADQNGNRVGYGKGFYDRFISSEASNALRVGVCIFPPIHEIADINPMDQRLHILICPEKSLAFDPEFRHLIDEMD